MGATISPRGLSGAERDDLTEVARWLMSRAGALAHDTTGESRVPLLYGQMAATLERLLAQ